MHTPDTSRRSFLALVAGTLVQVARPGGLTALAGPPSRTGAGDHPDPRAGVDGSRVLPPDQVPPQLAALFDGVRAAAPVVDGIRCRCGCAQVPGMYSLLSCYEGAGMARYCEICQGEGRLAVALHAEGRTLDEIRTAVDRRFG